MHHTDPPARRKRRSAANRLRSLRLALLFAATVGGATPAAALAAPTEPTVQIAGTGGAGVRLRDAPGLDGTIAILVPEGALVALLGATQLADGREWAPVRYGTAQGWVAASFLRGDEAATTATVTPLVAAAAPPTQPGSATSALVVGGQAIVTGTGGAGLRIRADASLNAPILGHAPFGATVAIAAGPRGDWYGVRHGGIEGWASGRFLTPAGSSTATGPTAAPTQVPAPAASVAPSANNTTLTAAALRYLGVPYVWGGTSPAGWDCSGFVVYVYHEVTGRTLPRTTQAQWGVGTPVARDALRAGDLVFFQNTYAPGITHVGFALGDGRFVHASAPGVGTVISSLADPYWGSHYAGARRV